MKKTLKPLHIFILGILFWFLSINQWEYYFYETTLFPLILAILSSIVYGILMFLIIKMRLAFRIASGILLFVYIAVLSLDTVAELNRRDQIKCVDFTEKDSQIASGSAEILINHFQNGQELLVVGKKYSHFMKRYKPINATFNLKEYTFVDTLVPDWFYRYADVIDPLKYAFGDSVIVQDKNDEKYYFSIRFGNFLSWQYPDHDLTVFIVDSSTNENIFRCCLWHMSGDLTYTASEKLVICPYPILRQLLRKREREDIFKRFYIYRNIIVYTFNSPFTRDLSKYRHIFKKSVITSSDLDSLGVSGKQRAALEKYVTKN